ncbi:FK506-binding protein 59 isoform X1 [Frankliniella occidentalis]|uniref:peptidylprolyl isomerase n=1 Tax=Frankliniella occidentalis TaxID=133901 RepID=A0A6J1TK17_FRAOC|nr:FK506-binding protein 59 isoform X1 [Frankliniella occidentalis]XP_026293653.1 FK506-binding protein 59 isoform X1 [Frankliniella occidentalis]
MAGEVVNPQGVDISKKKDGGVLKRIIQEGTGDELPSQGNKVKVHYTGTLLDGTKFDSSKDRNSPFEFKLGEGSVISAWDIGVATMKKGEVCMLTCRSDYAYGKAGSPPTIPPDATLQFEIEMIDWQGEDLSPQSNGGIIRTLITAGEGHSTPRNGAQVEVHLVGKYENKVFEDRSLNFCLGEGSDVGVVEGVEIALEKFKKAEKSRLKLKPEFAFGEAGKADVKVPSNAVVEYEVELKSFENEPEEWSLDEEGKVKQAQLYKEKGTKYFKAGNYKLAVKMYKKLLSFLEGEDTADPNGLILAGRLNAALCHLKLNENKDAVDQCSEALNLDPKNEKGLFRRGQGYLALGEPELAKKDFEAVVALAPENKAALNSIVICNTQIVEQKKKEKKIYANMFEKFAQKDREEKVSRFGWWDGLHPVTPAPYKDEDVEDAEKEKAKELKKKREFIERMKKQKMEREKEREETNHVEEADLPDKRREDIAANESSPASEEIVNQTSVS